MIEADQVVFEVVRREHETKLCAVYQTDKSAHLLVTFYDYPLSCLRVFLINRKAMMLNVLGALASA